MADTNVIPLDNAAAPPGDGRQDHDAMRRASMRAVSGSGTSDPLAAGGGLTLPGAEAHPELLAGADAPDDRAPVREMIPGERDPSTATHREPGAMGGSFSGSDIPETERPTWMDDRTAFEHTKEGGGG